MLKATSVDLPLYQGLRQRMKEIRQNHLISHLVSALPDQGLARQELKVLVTFETMQLGKSIHRARAESRLLTWSMLEDQRN